MDIDKIVNKVLAILKTQLDSEGTTELTGTLNVSPSLFIPENGSNLSYKNAVIGPVQFQTSYTSPPSVVFTQYGDIISNDSNNISAASNYVPFLVQPYIYNWNWSNGMVAGFYVGMYALTDPTTTPRSHKLVWRSSGTASRYLSPVREESWTLENNSYRPDYLEETADNRYETF